MNAAVAQIRLPHGLWVNGAHCRSAGLRALTGADEEFLAESEGTMLPVTRSRHLLARCLTHLDGAERITPEAIGELTVGDREALLLHLRQLTFGDRMQAILDCPQPECGELMDLDLQVSDLLQPPCPDPRPEYDYTAEHDGQSLRIRFRLPTVVDQELAGRQALSDPAAAADLLLRRCVKSVLNARGEAVDWSGAMLDGLPARMAELDPQAEMILDLVCPACKVSFSTIFDAGHYLFQEAGAGLNRLYHEVHLLAWHYHWSEPEIMGMRTRKRRRYLNLLLETLP
ncbi:MAG: hypothetical protein JSW39_18700 [Desulfobacterales bacterium]|nr:MAG: hypothetical protein JSW39_18700 [Desulfobacterales bacterium]